MDISPAQRLMLLMLCDLYKSPADREIDPDFIRAALYDGEHWALTWQYGSLANVPTSSAVVEEVVDILDMWSFVQGDFARLDAAEQDEFRKRTGRSDARFPGFDGNNEAEHLGVGRFLTEKLGRFASLKGQIVNSHHPTLDLYRQQVQRFKPIRSTLTGQPMSLEQLVRVVKG